MDGHIAIGAIEHLTKGWALLPFQGKRAHFWEEDTTTLPPKIRDGGRVRYYTALCGIVGVTDKQVPALNPGNWPRCKRCARAVKVIRAL